MMYVRHQTMTKVTLDANGNLVVAGTEQAEEKIVAIKPPEKMTMTITLATGDVVIDMLPGVAPKHCQQIKGLADSGFYDGLTFHRVIEGFMAQGGCPQGTGTGNAGITIPAEFSRVPHERGTCSMARSQAPDSASSQFFICFKKSAFLDGQYTVWGQVASGMDLVDQLMRGEPPHNPDKMLKVVVV